MNAKPLPTAFSLKVFATLAAAGLIAACGSSGDIDDQSGSVTPEIKVLSTRADLVSDGDALVEMTLPNGAKPVNLRVTLNGSDISSQFATRPNGRYQGIVTGLVEGTNTLSASVSQGKQAASLTITNYPRQGPIISGPQVDPYLCETDLLGLQPSVPPKCEAPTRYDYFYKPTGSSETDPFKVYDPNHPPSPSQIAVATTDEGVSAPFIVRRERGVINRAIYDIAVLQQPGQQRQPWDARGAWNGKLLMIFNGGTKNWHRQSLDGSIPDVLLVKDTSSPSSITGGDVLSRGFAVATSTISQVNNPVTSIETAMMVKEHFIEQYGPVRYTMGVGCSGGSQMQHWAANNYPGLLDGLIAKCSLADMWSAVLTPAVDYPLLQRYLSQTSPSLWPDKGARMAVYGGADADSGPMVGPVSASIYAYGLWFIPSQNCTSADKASEPQWVYDPKTNPGGVRCAQQDFQTLMLGLQPPSAWGSVEKTLGRGFTNSPVDNVGVQYGLVALLQGKINAEQFTDMNLKVGGIDIDGNWTAQRKNATSEGLANLYRSGLFDDASRLDQVPMLDTHTYGPVDLFHPLIGTDTLRERLVKAHGNADNLVHFITSDDQGSGANPEGSEKSYPMNRAAFLTMDKWLAAIEADHSNTPLAEKVRRDKPVDAKDTCYANGQPGAACPDAFVVPKMAAGGPVAADILKCQLKPLNWADYGAVQFSDDQKQRLQQAFPEGVCDWSKPGVGQQPSAGTWLTFARTVGGEPLGPEPKSVPVGTQH
ncbi:hypothetical protein K6W76_14335 [Burkholderia anthina]|uniref:DUF6351 family protein n=1 Tax=Burkholderia anthina TaxID=179879 RepID=UPI00158E4728|nr:DUF6351 family protein [Burkholderia anthina]MBY4867678.1 hypothetical protein [Burkholderia anthina]